MNNYTIETFLRVETPKAWVTAAKAEIPLLLVDHAHCEKKAAATALGLINRYSDRYELLKKMATLAREELRHFEQVLEQIKSRGEQFHPLAPGRYAASLHRHVIAHEPKKLIDTLIVGALIEARSCERFQVLTEVVEPELATFYRKLHAAEERHFLTYLSLAQEIAGIDISDRINFFAEKEAELIEEPDEQFRFHSGAPPSTVAIPA
jgi:tRNA-(ms[2]io[6]A)-hydroxylase